ncbi:uncharacterized protein LOC114354163 [Ostrinia furnacalis]|uniref:uncharacterized protein LOC114354163 n=1 Tax=Ostrinia furnacalis TaxID=93504 RepID=UPI00103FD7E3|nr:uncharacterized protein LOC114354163 [Ostrinia furnacalis]
MDPPSSDVPKLPDMVMCGDHPSFTKTELNAKEAKAEDKLKEKAPMSYARISPTTSRTERAASEHALRALQARHRVRSVEAVTRPAPDASAPNRALVQAALGSFRWPPYLLCVWVVVLVLTHALHCLVGVLERALPSFKKLCQYFRSWTEESWKTETELNHRVYPLALASVTGTLYCLYCVMYALHSVTLWAIEPLCPEDRERTSSTDVKVTNYIDEVPSKTNSNMKH